MNTRRLLPLCAALLGIVPGAAFGQAPSPGVVHAYPAPDGEPLSTQFKVKAEDTDVPVYVTRVVSRTPEERHNLGQPVLGDTSTASFASFDMSGEVRVAVTCPSQVKSVKVLPSPLGIQPTISGDTVTFTVAKPEQLTIEVNGDWIHSLHLFADPVETDVPSPDDPNVIYFGPGIHHVPGLVVPSGKTLYIAGGAILYGDPNGDNPRAAAVSLDGSDITLRGRGIIDGSLCPRGTRSVLFVHGSRINVEGVILRDSTGFTLAVRRSDQVKIDNVKIFGWRANSDGIDLCNSTQVEVSRCFLRTFDDLIVLKTDKNQGELRDVTVRNCVLWNEFAHALSLGAELREPLTDMLFTDCDIIHDKGREWLLRIFNADSAPVKNVVFDNIRIEEARRLMSVFIGQAVWSKESERGHVDGVTFRNIRSPAPVLPGPFAELVGFDAAHSVNGVQFQDVVVDGRPLKDGDLHQNEFVSGTRVAP